MIKTATTFIVGAGASRSYGLPVGIELKRKAIELKPRSSVFQLLMACGFRAEHITSVVADLQQHPAPSIDAFLETRQQSESTMRVGRALIAGVLGEIVLSKRLIPSKSDDDWLAYVIERMHRGAPTWEHFVGGNKNARFVTFNFDSIIEDRITAAVNQIYDDARASEAAIRFNRTNVVHVHGQLPSIPQSPIEDQITGGVTQEWKRWLPEASGRINVVLDAIPDDALEAARVAVRDSNVVCFLGFAYDTTNLERLGLPALVTKVPTTAREYFGSAYHFEPGERKWIESRFGTVGITLAEKESKCLATLRHCHVFRD